MKGCKDCPVYEKCEVTYRSSACEALRASYEVHSDPKVLTNADKIRSMTDEELAVFLDEFSGRCVDCEELGPDNDCPIHRGGVFCQPCDIMDWLKQPAKED